MPRGSAHLGITKGSIRTLVELVYGNGNRMSLLAGNVFSSVFKEYVFHASLVLLYFLIAADVVFCCNLFLLRFWLSTQVLTTTETLRP